MTNDRSKTGHKGEQLAVQLLNSKGYDILAQNWRYKRLEVDIITQIGSELVFVEVKTRNNDDFGFPEEWVDQNKMERIFEAAQAYIDQIGWSGEIRFDIIAITESPPAIDHFEDAFWPSW